MNKVEKLTRDRERRWRGHIEAPGFTLPLLAALIAGSRSRTPMAPAVTRKAEEEWNSSYR
jgi:hypothetical protein